MAHAASFIVTAAKKRKSSGFDLLWSEIDTLSPSAQHELTNLIGHHVVAAARTTGTGTTTPKMMRQSSRNDASQQNDHHSKSSSSSSRDGARRKQVVTSSMNEDEILHLVAQSRASLLGSICFLFDDHDAAVAGPKAVGAVSAMQVVKQCGLVVDPLHSPGRMDARDVVLAALFFLCGTSYLKIKADAGTKTNTSGDLLKLSYEKAYDWKWEEVKDKVMGDLEDAFYQDDPSRYDLLSRKRFLPAFDSDSVPSDARFNLVLKGVVPPTATPKITAMHEIVEK
jgi:hypothetical protein